MASSYDGKIECPHGLDSLWDDPLVGPDKMETADNAVQRKIGETGFCVLEDVDHPGVRAGGENHKTFAHDIHGHKAFVHGQWVRLPFPSVGRPAMLLGEPFLEGGDAGDLAADECLVVDDRLRLGRVDDASAMRAQFVDAWDILHRQHRAAWQFEGACPEHVWMRVEWDLEAVIAIADQVQCA